MNCHDVQSQLPAWLDGELTADAAELLVAHLGECSVCQAEVEALQNLDARLTWAFSFQREAATRIADSVTAAFNDETVAATMPVTNPARSSGVAAEWLKVIVAAAAGFLLAWLIFAPARREVAREEPQSPPSVVPQPQPSLAKLTVSTGSVEVRQPGQSEWSITSDLASFRCPSGTEVRTGAGVRCELETDARCTVRLNEATELAVRSAREIELRAGQVWCSSPADVSLQVVSTSRHNPRANAPQPAWSLVCPSNSVVQGEVDAGGGCRIFTANGEVDVTLGKEQQRLKRGEVAQIVDGNLVIEPHHADALLSTSWMQSLLVRKGHDSAELGDRVNRLLANLGRSKMANLYEDEIRSLGEHAVLPLLRFVQSPTSRDDPVKRQSAMTIIVDVAPTWLVGDLIGLLSDDEPYVRRQAATALLRLTRQDHGRAPADWSAPLSECEESLQRWRLWWEANAHRYELREKKPASTGSPRA